MKTALLVIDAQKIYTDPDSEMYCEDSDSTIERINRLINKFQQTNLPIIFVRHIHKKDGSDLGRMFDYLGEAEEDFNFKEGSKEVEYDDRLDKPMNSDEIVKTRYSAFTGTNLNQLLRKHNINKVVICGFMTNFCCESTARDAHGLDYYVDFVLDATGTPGTENMEEEKIRTIIGELLYEGFARVISTEELLEER